MAGILFSGGMLHAQYPALTYETTKAFEEMPRHEEVPSFEAILWDGAMPGDNAIEPGWTYPPVQAVSVPIEEMLVPEEPPPNPWKGSVELGLNGTQGNSQALNLRLGFDVERKTESNALSLDLDYQRNTSNAIETVHRMFLDWRWEWFFKESPWTWFVHGTTEYDEFQSFDVRVAADTGLGYRLIETDATSLVGRLGGGFSHEIGGPDDRYVPELAFGFELKHQLTKRQKLVASVDYTPDVVGFNSFRMTTRIWWQLLLDEQMNLSLKLSVLDLYDSTPNRAKPNDLDYAAMLLWSF